MPTVADPAPAALANADLPRLQERVADPDAVAALTAAGVHPVLARLFAARGIAAAAELDTELAGLLPFDRLLHADAMAGILADAIAGGRRLLIVGDYDADGATASAVGSIVLRRLGAQVDFLVPNRFEFGYGLTPEIVRVAAERKPDFIVTVDNGIASFDGIDAARRLGIDVLVTDHHLPGAELPRAQCIVNPNQPGCPFPSKHLAGVGVMFYTMLALRAELRRRGAFSARPEPNLAELLDLVALGTVADVVPLDRNNRILVTRACGASAPDARDRASPRCCVPPVAMPRARPRTTSDSWWDRGSTRPAACRTWPWASSAWSPKTPPRRPNWRRGSTR
jgi:single-stranded-DNA-specific exonuclease